MGREVKRVPSWFSWPMDQRWWGYVIPAVECGTCCVAGLPPGMQCPSCKGDAEIYPQQEVPTGDHWQMWETTSEGSPISPPFATPEELATWLADTKASSFGPMTNTREQWLGMILQGWAPSAMIQDGKITSGVEFVAEGKTK